MELKLGDLISLRIDIHNSAVADQDFTIWLDDGHEGRGCGVWNMLGKK